MTFSLVWVLEDIQTWHDISHMDAELLIHISEARLLGKMSVFHDTENITHLKERSITVITSPWFKRSGCCKTSPLTRVGFTELKLVKMT